MGNTVAGATVEVTTRDTATDDSGAGAVCALATVMFRVVAR
jgi:hypothetical protein